MPAQSQTSLRKTILMPRGLIEKVERIASAQKISFGEVVRRAVDAFCSDIESNDTVLLETLADTLIQTSKEAIFRVEKIEKRLDETHTMLRASFNRSHDVDLPR